MRNVTGQVVRGEDFFDRERDLDIEQVISVLLDPVHKVYFDYRRQRLFDELGRPDADPEYWFKRVAS